MEVVTDAVPSPARRRARDEDELELPGESDITIPASQIGSKPKEQQVADKAPSSVPQTLSPERTSRQGVPQAEAKATGPEVPSAGIPSSQIQNEQATGETNQHAKSRSPPSGTRRHGTKSSKASKERPTLHISHSNNVVVGSVNHFTVNQNHTKQNDGSSFYSLPKAKQHQFNRLFNSRSPVVTGDIIIVSEVLDRRGRQKLAQLLGLSEAEIAIKQEEYKSKGPQEICYQTLEYWRLSCCGGENQSAMLSRLCDKLVEVWSHGGDKALDRLYREHFGESSPS